MFRLAMMSSAVCALMLFGAGCSDDHDYDHAHVHGDGAGHAHPHGDDDGEGPGHDADGHDHAHGDSHGDDHDGGGDAADAHDHGHGAGAITHAIDAAAFGGRSMTVEVAGSLTPGSELHVEGSIDVGEKAPVLRMWVGTETGVGSMKARGDVHGGHFHVHVVVPDEVPAGSALWIEAMGADGERQSVSIPVE